MVRAPFSVVTFSTTVYLSGESSLITVSTPSCPHELKTYFVPGSNHVASTPAPIGTVVTTLPVSAFITDIILLSQPEKRRRDLASMARPDGSSHGASGHLLSTESAFESISITSLLSSMLT